MKQDKEIEELLKSIERQKSSAFKLVVFYIVSVIMLIVVAGFMIPTAHALKLSKGIASVTPLIFLSFVWLYAFFISRKKIYKDRVVEAYGWIMGITALVTVLMLYYLQSVVKG